MQNAIDSMFSEYVPRRASDDIADQIKKAILAGKFHKGDRLPSERSLATQFNVSRMTVREALRLLEAKGLVYIKKGSTGGAFLQAAFHEQIASIVIDRLQLDGITINHVIETRVVLERGVVRYVIENADDRDIALLQKNLEKQSGIRDKDRISVEQSKKHVSIILEFHKLLAEATHIPPLVMFSRTIIEWGERKTRHWFPTKDEILLHYKSHKEIFECIKKSHVIKGQNMMEKHIRETMPIFEKLD